MHGERLDEIRDLLSRCDEEFESISNAAVLRSRFSELLTAETFRQVVEETVECQALVLGAHDAAQHAGWSWPADVLLRVGVLAAHLGRGEEAAEIASICLGRMPGSTECISLWAETAPTTTETIDRYVEALARADDRDSVELAARHYALHSAESEALLQRLATGLRMGTRR